MNWSHPAFGDLAQWLGAGTGLAFPADRIANAEHGFRRAMKLAGESDPDRYLKMVKGGGRALDNLIAELTVGETYFFREPAQFGFLRESVLPEIMGRRGQGAILRAWSAGCSSGEEAYSLAILLAEAGLREQSNILATDLSKNVLSKAKQACYGPWSLRGEGASLALPYLRQEGNRYLVSEAIRRMVRFEALNLVQGATSEIEPITRGMDLILCRNVLIYLDRESVRRVAVRLFDSLAEGGWLITASSDPPLVGDAPFETLVTEKGLFYRRRLAKTSAQISIPGLLERADSPSSVPLGAAAEPVPEILQRSIRRRVVPVERAKGPKLAEVLETAREDLARGRYRRAVERTRGHLNDAGAVALHVRALANLNAVEAEQVCTKLLTRHALVSELHYLRAVLMLGLGREDEALSAARRALYLDRSLAIAHFLEGVILRRRGDRPGAWRAFRNARDLCEARPADEVITFSDGETAAQLAGVAQSELDQLAPLLEVSP